MEYAIITTVFLLRLERNFQRGGLVLYRTLRDSSVLSDKNSTLEEKLEFAKSIGIRYNRIRNDYHKVLTSLFKTLGTVSRKRWMRSIDKKVLSLSISLHEHDIEIGTSIVAYYLDQGITSVRNKLATLASYGILTPTEPTTCRRFNLNHYFYKEVNKNGL